MKKFKFSILAGILLLVSSVAFAGNIPAGVQAAFKKLYPQVANAEWSRKSDYHIATFILNRQETSVWFGKSGGWIMTETNVESLDNVPAPVAKAFMKGETPPLQIRYIKVVTFPKMPTVIIIDTKEYNSGKETQLFYAPDGTLLQSYDVSGGGGEIYPELFG